MKTFPYLKCITTLAFFKVLPSTERVQTSQIFPDNHKISHLLAFSLELFPLLKPTIETFGKTLRCCALVVN